MYSEKDLQEVALQKKKFFWGIGIFSLIMLAIITYGAVLRNSLITVIFSVLWIFTLIFLWGTVGNIIFSYFKFLKDVLRGRSKIASGCWGGISEEVLTREGVDVREAILLDEGQQRVLYFDCNKEIPKVEKGDVVTVETFGNFVIRMAPGRHETFPEFTME